MIRVSFRRRRSGVHGLCKTDHGDHPMRQGTILAAALIASFIILLVTPAVAQQPPLLTAPKPALTQHDWYRHQGAPDSKCTKDCGPTSVAMAIQFATGKEVRIEDIRKSMTDDRCVDTGPNDWGRALNQDKWEVNGEETTGMSVKHREITGMEAVVRAVNDWHIVIVPVRMHIIDEGEDIYKSEDDSEDDPKYYKNRYVNFSKPPGDHVLVVKGISIENGGKWVIVYDPNVWGKSGKKYYYSNGEPKGKNRYYDYDQFKDAFEALGNKAIEILETPSGSGGCADYSHTGVVLFDSVDCDGSKREFSAPLGLINLSDTEWNDRVRSIHIDSGWSMKVYQHERGRGASKCVTRSLWDFLLDLSKVRFENSDILVDGEISSIEVFHDSACGKGLAPVLYGQSEFPILEPSEEIEIYFTLLNAGSQTWEAGHYTLVNVNGQPLGARPQMALNVDVPSGSPVPWPFSVTAPVVPGVYRTEWRFSYDGQLIGPLLWTEVIVVPPGSDDLAGIIRSMLEEARRDAEDWIEKQWEELRRRIIEMIEAEIRRRIEEFLGELCGGSVATMILCLSVLWLGHRRSGVGNREH